MRATTSTVVPPVSGTMIVMGRLGYWSACAADASATAVSIDRIIRTFFKFSSRAICCCCGDSSVLNHDCAHRRSFDADDVEGECHQGHATLADPIEVADVRHRNYARARI